MRLESEKAHERCEENKEKFSRNENKIQNNGTLKAERGSTGYRGAHEADKAINFVSENQRISFHRF